MRSLTVQEEDALVWLGEDVAGLVLTSLVGGERPPREQGRCHRSRSGPGGGVEGLSC